MEANNTSVKPTNKVTVYVYRTLHLHADGHSTTIKKEVYRQTYKGFEPSFFGVRWLPFPIPLVLQPTTNAGLVQHNYYLVVECDIPGALDLDVVLPTTILAPQWLFSKQPPPPPVITLPPDASFRPPWQPDETVSNCSICSASFGIFTRKHHCRHCVCCFFTN
jgi:hypothetical protein